MEKEERKETTKQAKDENHVRKQRQSQKLNSDMLENNWEGVCMGVPCRRAPLSSDVKDEPCKDLERDLCRQNNRCKEGD